jgi:hypothetical protein
MWTSQQREAIETPCVTDIAWAAGIYEGEGCITDRGTGIQVSQRDRWLLDRLRSLFGGTVGGPYSQTDPTTSNRKPIHRWILHGVRAQAFIVEIWPYLSPRRQKQLAELRDHKFRVYRPTVTPIPPQAAAVPPEAGKLPGRTGEAVPA